MITGVDYHENFQQLAFFIGDSVNGLGRDICCR